MAMAVDPAIAHLLRRAGFGHSPSEGDLFNQMSLSAAIDTLVDFEQLPDTVDNNIGMPGFLGTTTRGPFQPNTRISDARQRWLFRLVHSQRPLQEKMALFWHNHFATGFSKIAGQITPAGASRALGAKPSEDANGVRGQYELFRQYALGNFRDLLIQVSQDPAMVAWLDGDTNFKANPQENYARELMELFTMGVDYYTESDVYAGARVFTGWNLFRIRSGDSSYPTFFFRSGQHDTDSKTFSFPIYPDGGKTIPARSEADGFQDGLDLINAVAAHPETGPRLARKLYAFFVSEFKTPPESVIQQLAQVYYSSAYDMRAVVRSLLSSPEFQDPANYFTRYSWPVEYVVRLVKSVGWAGLSAASALTPLANMGQILFEPPDVSGWRLGTDWFSTGTLLARMNFASTLAGNQQFNLQNAATSSAATPESLLAFMVDRLGPAAYDTQATNDLLTYLAAGGPWTGSSTQVRTKTAGLAHLIGGSSECQFV
jgi:uncharacterized protein (DUF1800 family)